VIIMPAMRIGTKKEEGMVEVGEDDALKEDGKTRTRCAPEEGYHKRQGCRRGTGKMPKRRTVGNLRDSFPKRKGRTSR
jgi:hypothetical protein